MAKEICCVCIQRNQTFKTISEADEENIKFVDKLITCVPNEIWQDSFVICEECLQKLNAAYEFVQICVKNETYRKQILLYVENKNNVIDTLPSIKNEIPLYSCDGCGKSFKLKRILKLHITRMHIKKNKKLTTDKLQSLNKVEEKIKPENDAVDPEDCPEPFVNKERQFKTENDKENKMLNVRLKRSSETVDYDETSDTDDKFCANIDSDDNFIPDTDTEPKEEPLEDEENVLLVRKTAKRRGPKVKEPLACSYCGETFYKKQLFYAHIRSKHTFEKPFACDQCEARYMNGYSLLIHKRKHNNEKPFICASCGKSFISSADLNHHSKIHDSTRRYTCAECDRSFKTHSNLRTHRLQMHLNPADWKFHCTICDKKFPIRGNLVKHLKRHTGVKNFGCHICDKKFINKAELGLHINTHSSERLFKCQICFKEYKNREGRRRHMKVIHNLGNWKASVPDKKYLCPMCPKTFAFSNKLQRHIYSHTGEKPYKCDYCTKKFVDNYSRKVHMKREHGIEVY